MRTYTWTPGVGDTVWTLPNRFAGEIIGFRLGEKRDRKEWQVRYVAEAKGFDNKTIKAEAVGWFPTSKLDRRID